jgi:hypothetical protein
MSGLVLTLLGKIAPFAIKLMMDSPGALWGVPCYAVEDVLLD